MNLTSIAQTALAVCLYTSLTASQAFACAACLALGDDHAHVGPEAADVASAPWHYSYDQSEPTPGDSSPNVPVYNSLPGAHAKLFLDFDGVDFGTTKWSGKTPGERPAYDLDGDASEFSTEELSRIEQIWSRVAEAYSPFNINVTTVNPGNYNRKESAHVVVTGDNSWYGSGGGVAFVGGFASSFNVQERHTAWVFPDNLRSGDAKVIADAAIHEAGHLFGLNHQRTYDDSGEKTDEYDNNSSSPIRAPILGVAYNSRRGLWSLGPGTSAGSIVNELGVISRSTNGFGYIADEVGVSFSSAPEIELTTDPLRGVISRTSDVDYYKIELDQRSDVSLLVDVASYGPMLDAKLSLYDVDYALLEEDDPTLSTSRSSLTASFAGELDAGTYFLSVTSHGGYTYDSGTHNRTLQDTGQYFLSGAVIALVPEPAGAALLFCGVAAVFPRRRRIRS